jgi:anoctamin-10
LTALSFLINNWIELRADSVKICVEMQRPVPWRADSIGPWLDSLGFLAWLGSITSAGLVFLFSGDGLGPDGTPWGIKAWALLLTIVFSEHIYFAVRIAVRNVLSKFDTPGLVEEKRERYQIRKRYFDESNGVQARLKIQATSEPHKLDKASLEDDIRNSTLHDTAPGLAFWTRQKNWEEAARIGSGIIQRSAPEAKKEK